MAEQEETPTKIIHADTKHEIGVMVGFIAIMGIAVCLHKFPTFTPLLPEHPIHVVPYTKHPLTLIVR